MKTIFKHVLLGLSFVLLGLTSCEQFLDMTPVEQLTFDKVWEKRSSAEAYLATVYGYMPNHYDANGSEQAIFGVTDESSMSWPNYKSGPGTIANGTWGPSLISLSGGSLGGAAGGVPWVTYYRGIREATIFMDNIDRVPDSEIEPGKRAEYKIEARFLRAYYYYQLMKFYGPVVLIGDKVLDPTGSQEELSKPRNSWDECVDYVVSELTACVQDPSLPLTRPSTEYGRPTKGAALSVSSRLLLYSARPLFNGNPMYVGVQNKDGKKLFAQSYDAVKWKKAADAAAAVIDLGLYDLYTEGNDPYQSYAGVFWQRWNQEIILGRNAGSNNMAIHITPRYGVADWGAYGGWGPTQQQVDAYAMADGKYPVTGYQGNGQPIIDPTSSYPTAEFAATNYTHPFDKVAKSTPAMYQNREPRFYVTVLWNSQKWYQPNGRDVYFNTGGNSGPPEQDHARTGYLNRKWAPVTNSPKEGIFATFSWAYIRYAEILLNYIEALNESDGPANSDIKLYWNKIRSRVGLPAIETVYPGIFASKEQVREYILKERRVELAFEGHRYFDTRTWMLKTNGQPVDNGPMWGMNVGATNSDFGGAFWQRTNTETRVFRDAFYLLPLSQNELNKNHNLTQNYGW